MCCNICRWLRWRCRMLRILRSATVARLAEALRLRIRLRNCQLWLLALDGRLHCLSNSGERIVNAEDFFHGPYETELRPDEIMRMISVPKRAAEHRVAFQEVARRHGDYAMAGVAVGADGGDRLSDVRIAFSGLAIAPCARRPQRRH